MKKFLLDFVAAFFIFGSAAVIMVLELITQAVYTLQKFWDNIVKPAAIELMADVNMILNILLQSFYELSSKLLLFVSKTCLNLAHKCHQKSEKLIDKCWV